MRFSMPHRFNVVVLAALMGCANASMAGSRADDSFAGFNSAFLVQSGGTFYKNSFVNGSADGTWSGSLDILVAEDAYERTGEPSQKALVESLLTTWLKSTPTPWAWDGWNDDIGWFSLALIRGYQMTGDANFLTAAKYGFDMAGPEDGIRSTTAAASGNSSRT